MSEFYTIFSYWLSTDAPITSVILLWMLCCLTSVGFHIIMWKAQLCQLFNRTIIEVGKSFLIKASIKYFLMDGLFMCVLFFLCEQLMYCAIAKIKEFYF